MPNLQNVVDYHTRDGRFKVGIIVPPEDLLHTFLVDGGTDNMAVIGSLASPVKYKYACPAGKLALITAIMFTIQDKGIVPSAFGGIPGGLTNGIKVDIVDSDGSTVLKDFSAGQPFTNNAELERMHQLSYKIDTGPGDDIASTHWMHDQHPIILTAGQALQVTIQDDLTGLVHMHWTVEGITLDATKEG